MHSIKVIIHYEGYLPRLDMCCARLEGNVAQKIVFSAAELEILSERVFIPQERY